MCVITSSKLDEALYNMLKLLHFSLVHLYLDEITQVLLPLGENYDRDLTKWTFFLFFLMTNLFFFREVFITFSLEFSHV